MKRLLSCSKIGRSIRRNQKTYLYLHIYKCTLVRRAYIIARSIATAKDMDLWYDSFLFYSENSKLVMMLSAAAYAQAYLEGDVVVLGVDLRLLRGHAPGVLRLQKMDADAVVEQPAVRTHRPIVSSTSGIQERS
jgi:hypothetical protein